MLSIIIPSRNEESYITGVITSIKESNIPYPYEIILSDNSTDNTRNIVKNLDSNIRIVNGGPTPIARNNGVKHANGEYILFIDSDITFKDTDLIYKTLSTLISGKSMVTAKSRCRNSLIVNLIYFLNNILQYVSKLDGKPFATGSFMGIKKDVFYELGGFNEEALHCEDYLLSKRVTPNEFTILNKYFYTDNRRFKKMGYLGMIKYFYNNIKHRNDDSYFYEEINYWK